MLLVYFPTPVQATHGVASRQMRIMVNDTVFEVYGYDGEFMIVTLRLRDIAYMLQGTSARFDIRAADNDARDFWIVRGENYTPQGNEFQPIPSRHALFSSSYGFILGQGVGFYEDPFQQIWLGLDGDSAPAQTIHFGIFADVDDVYFCLYDLGELLGFGVSWGEYGTGVDHAISFIPGVYGFFFPDQVAQQPTAYYNPELTAILAQIEGRWVDRAYYYRQTIDRDIVWPVYFDVFPIISEDAWAWGWDELRFERITAGIGFIDDVAQLGPIGFDGYSPFGTAFPVYIYSRQQGIVELRYEFSLPILTWGYGELFRDEWNAQTIAAYQNRRLIIDTRTAPISEITYYIGTQSHTMIRFDSNRDPSRYNVESHDDYGIRLTWQVRPFSIPSWTETLRVYRSTQEGERGNLLREVALDEGNNIFELVDVSVQPWETYFYSVWQTSWVGEREPIQIGGQWQMVVHVGDVLGQDDTPGEYEYGATHPRYLFTPTPAVLAQVYNQATASNEIFNTLESLTPQQRGSADAINIVTLQIENIARRGTTQNVPSDGSFNAPALRQSIMAAQGIHHQAMDFLAQDGVNLMRDLRIGINFVTDDAGGIFAAFPDDVSDMDFINITIESDFAAVTLNPGHIPVGGEITVRWVEAEDDSYVAGMGTVGDGYRAAGDGTGRAASPTSQNQGFFATLFDFTAPLLTMLFNFWSLIVIAIMLIIWLIVESKGEKLRRWVVPTFAILALVANISLVVVRHNARTIPVMADYPIVADDDAQNQDNDTQAESTPKIAAVEVTMSPGMRATLSIPINGQNPEFLVLVNQDNEIQHSRYNPVTGNIDGRIRTSGIYTLRENQISFIDIEGRSQLMQTAINQLASRGIMQGNQVQVAGRTLPAENHFRPDDPITRTEMVATIVMAFDMLDFSAQAIFTDIPQNAWYYHAVATARQAQLVEGYPDNTFRGGNYIPKDQLVVMAANALVGQMGYHAPEDIEYFLARFLDRDRLTRWSEDGIALATASNVLIHRSDNMFAPQSTMTRGDAAIILYRVFSRIW